MEAAGKVATAFNAQVLKEPRGFIKPIEWILSIFAFATMTSVSSSLTFKVMCPPNATEPVIFNLKVSYPFDIQNSVFNVPICNESASSEEQGLLEGSSTPAEFFVFVGVMVFIYCICALIFYIFFDDLYRKNNSFVIGDFVISVILTVLWLISSSAWAQGLSDLKYYTDLEECGFFHGLADCKDSGVTCSQTEGPHFASLNVSVIFGFLNMIVWGGNLWFLFKETPWFKIRSKPPFVPGVTSPTDPQRV